jgi:hypothetical protein
MAKLGRLQACFTASASEDPTLPCHLAEQVIMRDYEYRKGRPRQEHRSGQHFQADADAYLSFFCYYGLEGHHTGLPEFNRMYRAMVVELEQSLEALTLDRQTARCLTGVIACYQDRHPARVRSGRGQQLLQKLQEAAR